MNANPITDTKSLSALEQGLFVIEMRVRKQDKSLPPYTFRASFGNREDAFSVYGKWHQEQDCRIIDPNLRK